MSTAARAAARRIGREDRRARRDVHRLREGLLHADRVRCSASCSRNCSAPADLGDFAIVNNFVSIINNTVVQGTIQGVSKLTAEDDARAGAVQRAGLRLQAGAGAGARAAGCSSRRADRSRRSGRRRACTPYFRIAALIPLLYAMYAVFVGSANGLRRFRTQASFDVGFSTMKTILLLGCALVWSVDGRVRRLRRRGGRCILVVASRVMRLPAGGEPFPIRRIASFMGAVVVYTALLNLALNSDLLLLRQFALSAPGVDATAAAAVAGNYEALRTFALLPYQALLVVTFVIFPLVSRATFAADREATRAYVSQTMRYALILAGLMGIVLAARPSALFGTIYKPELRRRRGRAADPGRRAVLPGAAVGRLLDPERGRADARAAAAHGRDAGDRCGGHRDLRAARRARDADADRGGDARPRSRRRPAWWRRWSCCGRGSAACRRWRRWRGSGWRWRRRSSPRAWCRATARSSASR